MALSGRGTVVLLLGNGNVGGRCDQCQAGVHRQHYPRDPSGVVAGQVEGGSGDVPSRPLGAEGCGVLAVLSQGVVHAGGHHGRIDESGRDTVDPDVVMAVVGRHGHGQADYRGL